MALLSGNGQPMALPLALPIRCHCRWLCRIDGILDGIAAGFAFSMAFLSGLLRNGPSIITFHHGRGLNFSWTIFMDNIQVYIETCFDCNAAASSWFALV